MSTAKLTRDQRIHLKDRLSSLRKAEVQILRNKHRNEQEEFDQNDAKLHELEEALEKADTELDALLGYLVAEWTTAKDLWHEKFSQRQKREEAELDRKYRDLEAAILFEAPEDALKKIQELEEELK